MVGHRPSCCLDEAQVRTMLDHGRRNADDHYVAARQDRRIGAERQPSSLRSRGEQAVVHTRDDIPPGRQLPDPGGVDVYGLDGQSLDGRSRRQG
jgi:hypothetical protein